MDVERKSKMRAMMAVATQAFGRARVDSAVHTYIALTFGKTSRRDLTLAEMSSVIDHCVSLVNQEPAPVVVSVTWWDHRNLHHFV